MANTINVDIIQLENVISKIKSIDNTKKINSPLNNSNIEGQGLIYYNAKIIEQVIKEIEYAFDYLVYDTISMLEEIKKEMLSTDLKLANKIGGS